MKWQVHNICHATCVVFTSVVLFLITNKRPQIAPEGTEWH